MYCVKSCVFNGPRVASVGYEILHFLLLFNNPVNFLYPGCCACAIAFFYINSILIYSDKKDIVTMRAFPWDKINTNLVCFLSHVNSWEFPLLYSFKWNSEALWKFTVWAVKWFKYNTLPCGSRMEKLKIWE